MGNGTFSLMRSPYFRTEEAIFVYNISLDRQLKLLFVHISFTEIGKLGNV